MRTSELSLVFASVAWLFRRRCVVLVVVAFIVVVVVVVSLLSFRRRRRCRLLFLSSLSPTLQAGVVGYQC
jgi:hypothetical protein